MVLVKKASDLKQRGWTNWKLFKWIFTVNIINISIISIINIFIINICQEEMQNLKSVITCLRFEMLPLKKQPPRGVSRKRRSKNMQQIYRRTPMLNCDFNEVALQLYWNHASIWVLSYIFDAYFWNSFS